MNENDVEQLILGIDGVDLNPELYERPSEADWLYFRQKYGTDFGEVFVAFTNLMSKYNFTGETFKISFDNNNLNEEIYSVHEHEKRYENWNSDMLPIIGYGDGDYICLSIGGSINSKVYSFDHEKNAFSVIGNSFGEWLAKTDGYE